MRFGLDFTKNRSEGYTHALLVEFKDRRAFEGWGPHPLHESFAAKWIRGKLLDTKDAIRKLDVEAPDEHGTVTDHTVFFEMKPSFTAAHAATAHKGLASTIACIPGVRRVAFGKSFASKNNASFQYALTVTMTGRHEFSAYAPHPLHRLWAANHLVGHLLKTTAIDIESPAGWSRL